MTLIGRSMCQLIVDAGLDTLPKMYAATHNELSNIPGMGGGRANSFHAGIRSNEALIERILKHVTIKTKSGTMLGKTMCCTGFRDQALSAAFEAQGGTVKDSAGKSLHFLVAKDASSGSSKIVAATNQGLQTHGKKHHDIR